MVSQAKGPDRQFDSFLVRDALHEVIDQVRGELGEETTGFIRSLLDHGEYQVAIETLCDQLYEYSIGITSEIQGHVNRAAREMQFDSPRLSLLARLVNELD